jgi:pullulanase/glycogen debranching enzyme
VFSVVITASGPIKYSEEERLQGYKYNEGQSVFIFDELVYNVEAVKVIVEGSFRGWDHNLEDTKWWLSPVSGEDGLWILLPPEPIIPGSEFKFRINEGVWLSAPEHAPNNRGGNLIFAHQFNFPKLRAEIVSARDIRVFLIGENVEITMNPDNYSLLDKRGVEIQLAKVFYIRPHEVQLYPTVDLDKRRVYYLQEKRYDIQVPVLFDGWFRNLYSDKKLGAYYDLKQSNTQFRIFAPRATGVTLYLYHTPERNSYAKHHLHMDQNGVWEIQLPGNLNGVYYDYTVSGFNDPGNHFYETTPVHINDPYAQVSVDSWGPARVWPAVKPPRPVKGGRPAMEDVIAYEVHIQDFTRQLPVNDDEKGSFTAFAKRGLKNSAGESIGFDHIIDLGVNVVHLQPIQEFLHFPDSLWKATFVDDLYMIEQGIHEENYQWGYRTTFALAIESRYRKKGSDWGAQNQQFRDLVEAFHDQGIAVIVDVVFNHTGERMDQRMDHFNFSVLDKQYYYRNDDQLNYIGEYGTEVKSEERPMVQRWIVDQCLNLVNQYGVDGFRIDLAGQTDEQTLKELIRILPQDIIVYGEPWIASADPDYEANPDWDWYKVDSPITFFQDESRNAFKGPPSNPQDKINDRGYAGGSGDRESVKQALSCGFETDDTPIDGINYLDIHDNWALADRFAVSDWDGRKGVEEDRVKIAAAMLFTSLGPIVLHGGTEILRSKAHAPLHEIVKQFQGGPIYIHGKRDTYNLARANEYIWENKGKDIGDENGQVFCNYRSMYDYWRGLIKLRQSKAGEVFRIDEKPAWDYFNWIEPLNTHLLGYIVNKTVFVLLNTDSADATFSNVTLPLNTNWQLVADIDRIDVANGLNLLPESKLEGGYAYDFFMPAASLKIWVCR